MRTASVVEFFQILEDVAACHFRVWKAASMHEFGPCKLAGSFHRNLLSEGKIPSTVMSSMG